MVAPTADISGRQDFPVALGGARTISSGIDAIDPTSPPAAANSPSSDAIRFRWDVVLFAGFVLTTAPEATGVPLHEWISLALIPVIVVHLALNWQWIVRTTRQTFRRLPGEMRINHVLDALLFIVMTLTMVSGILASRSALRTFGFTGPPDRFWDHVHGMFAFTTLSLVGVHVAMHVRWIAARLSRRKAPAPAGARTP